MSVAHFRHYAHIDEAIIGFTKFCRENELKIGLNHGQEALSAASKGFALDAETMRMSLQSIFCACPEDQQIFDRCFHTFWGKRKHDYAHRIQNQSRSNVTKKSNASLVMMGFQPKGASLERDLEDAHNVTGVSRIESLKQTDFSKVREMDSALLDRLAEQLIQQLNHRLRRKLTANRRGRIDIRRTIRKNMSNGDLLMNLSRMNRKQERYRLNLLLDVSGSMDKYSFYLLKFIWSLKSNLNQIEAFVFSTRMVRITEFLRQDQLDSSILGLNQHANHWSGGTRIGECLQVFNDTYAKRVLNGRNITIILSDGLDNGQPELLASELAKIKMRTKKLIWLNPLKGTPGYEPLAGGIQAALPLIDDFGSAHNLASLLELENMLSYA